jgi:hypothetical protein
VASKYDTWRKWQETIVRLGRGRYDERKGWQ